MLPGVFSIIDIGSNTFHQIIADVSPNFHIDLISRQRTAFRLLDFSESIPTISQENIRRAIEIINGFKEAADSHSAIIIAAGTAALREAVNSSVFISEVYRETGVQIKIFDSVEELQMIWKGALAFIERSPLTHKAGGRPNSTAAPGDSISPASLPSDYPSELYRFRSGFKDRSICVLDIGGGSTEIILGEKEKIIYSQSLSLGTVRCSQMFFNDDYITQSGIIQLNSYLKEQLAEFEKYGRSNKYPTLIGTSGLFRNICSLKDSLLNSHDSLSFTVEDLDELFKRIMIFPHPGERKKHFTVNKMINTDILPTGLLILKAIMETLCSTYAIYSCYGFREGLILDYIHNNH